MSAALCLFLSACKSEEEILSETQSIPLNNVEHAEIEIDMNSGILILNGAAQGKLIEGSFSYSDPNYRPVTTYEQDGAIVQATIRQPSRDFLMRQSHNEWNIHLSNDIPVDLTLNLGTGIHTLKLGGLNLSSLEINSDGGGVIMLDLAGFWEEDQTIIVRGGQATAITLTAPQGTGTRIETQGRIRKLDIGNFLREQDSFVNSAYHNEGPKIVVKLDGNFGNLSLTSGFPRDMPIDVALKLAQSMFSQHEIFDCSTVPIDRQPMPSDTVRELWYDYLCHRGPEHRVLDGNTVLTQDLAGSELVDRIRRQFYAGEPLEEATLYFNIPEFLSATVDMAAMIQTRQQYEFSITHFIGSFDYSVTQEGDRVRFVIHNKTDRSSGTHIPLRFPEGGYTYSIEELVRQEPLLADAFLFEVIHSGKYPIISILESKSRAETGPGEGGGDFTQMFTWTERKLELTELPPWPTYLEEIDIK